MKVLLTIVLLLGLSSLHAQSNFFQANVKDFQGSRVYLMQFIGDQQVISDSTTSLNGVFRFQFNDKFKPGVYRIILGENNNENFFDEDPRFFDFIYNSENIILNTHFNYPMDSMVVQQSVENEIYYRFLKTNSEYQSKLGRITPLFSIYKPEDSFYHAVYTEFMNLQNSFARFSLDLTAKHPGTIATSIIQTSMLPVIEEAGSPGEMKNFVKEHFFDLVSFSDSRLVNSPAITKAILEYLGLYRNPQFDQSQQEDNFILAVDHIMEAASANPAVYDFVLNFLVDGFQRFQMEKVLVHIAENFIEGECETDSQKLLQKRLEGYEKMAPGKKVPDILNFDQNGKQVRLYDLKNEYTLVLFWASWCPHCNTFLKQLAKWYPSRTVDLEIFAVSIDSSRFEWEEQSLMSSYPWINTFSGAGWDGKAPKDYSVYATPTLFLLDKDRKIIAKPLTFKEFKKEVEILAGK